MSIKVLEADIGRAGRLQLSAGGSERKSGGMCSEAKVQR
jgi:hypothetical protein